MKVNPVIMEKVNKIRAEKLDVLHCLSVNVCPRCGASLTICPNLDGVAYYCSRCVFVKNVADVIAVK